MLVVFALNNFVQKKKHGRMKQDLEQIWTTQKSHIASRAEYHWSSLRGFKWEYQVDPTLDLDTFPFSKFLDRSGCYEEERGIDQRPIASPFALDLAVDLGYYPAHFCSSRPNMKITILIFTFKISPELPFSSNLVSFRKDSQCILSAQELHSLGHGSGSCSWL